MIRDVKDMTSFKWATVRGTSPLSIQLDGDPAPLALIPESLVDPADLKVLDRVRVELSLRKVVIHGKSNGLSAGNGDYSGVADPTQWSAHLGQMLIVPTHVSPPGGQTTHPSVLYFDQPWNGYRYWMAHTPYPGGDDEHEDPNIAASQDGIAWVVPSGLTNPLDDASGTAYNSDVELVMSPDGTTMMLIWRWFDPTAGAGSERFYMRTSTNGTTWTPKVLIHQSNEADLRIMSPTLVFEDGAWTMWGVDILTNPNRFVRRRSNGPVLNSPSNWGPVEVCSIDVLPSGKDPWHIQVRKVNDQYIGLLSTADLNVSGTNGEILLVVSEDGLSWRSSRSTVIPRNGAAHNALYRASLVPRMNGGTLTFDVWYGAWTTSPVVWNIFKTVLAPTQLIGADSGWIPLGLPSGATNQDSVTAIRRVGDMIDVRISVAASLASGGTLFLTGVPTDMMPLGDIVRASTFFSSRPGMAAVYPRGHTNAGQVLLQQFSGTTTTWAIGRFNYFVG